MKLYYHSGACSLSPHIVLCESGLDFEVERVDLATKKTEKGESFLTINPKGQVPALALDDGNLLTEGVAIIQYIADRAPSKHLIPASQSFDHYKALEWLNYIATELHKGFGPLFNPKYPEEIKQLARQQLQQKFTYVDQQLKNHDYLLGKQFTIADPYLYTILTWAIHLQFDLNNLPNLSAFIKRMQDRPAVKKALAAEK